MILATKKVANIIWSLNFLSNCMSCPKSASNLFRTISCGRGGDTYCVGRQKQRCHTAKAFDADLLHVGDRFADGTAH